MNPWQTLVPMKKVTHVDREEGEEVGREKKSKFGEEVAAALEVAAKGLEACLDDLKEEPGQAELIRGTTEVVKATSKLIVCLKERQTATEK